MEKHHRDYATIFVGTLHFSKTGDVVRIRDDPWLPNGSNFQPVWWGSGVGDLSINLFNDLVNPESGQWNFQLIRSLFSDATAERILKMSTPNPD